MIQYHYASVMQCRRDYYFYHGLYVSALEHIRMLILSSYVLLACTNRIYKNGHAWGIIEMIIKFQF